MRSKLLSSFLFVAFFWWALTTLWWSLSDPELNRQALVALAHTFWFFHITVPDHVSILDALSIQRQVLEYWTLPIALAVALFAGIGQGLVWFGAKRKADERSSREQAGKEYRGINITLGAMPRPMSLKLDALELSTDDVDKLDTLTEKEKALLLEVLGVLSANPKAYAGEGHSVSILELAIVAVEQALSHKTRPGLAAIVAAANELGKITSYSKDGSGAWLLTKNLCRESATQLAVLPAWWNLPTDDRMAVSFAVRYNDSPDTLIDAGGNKSVLNLAKSLLYKAAAATEKASTEERERVLAKQELPDLALKVFLDNLNQIPFQDGLPKGVPAFGWKIGSRVFLLEIKLRESLLLKLPEDVRGALATKEKRGLHPFSIELMKAFNAKGWLVKEHNGAKVTAREALWNIQAGKLPYKGVIVLDIPPEYREMLPTKESIYKVEITGPLFSNAGGASMSSKDMANMGLVGGGAGAPERKPRPMPDARELAKPVEEAGSVKVESDADLELAGLRPAARSKPPADVIIKTLTPPKDDAARTAPVLKSTAHAQVAASPVEATTPVPLSAQATPPDPVEPSAVDAPSAESVQATPATQPAAATESARAPASGSSPAGASAAAAAPAPALKTAGVSAAQKAKNEMMDLLREPAREVRLSAKDAARQANKAPQRPSPSRGADTSGNRRPVSQEGVRQPTGATGTPLKREADTESPKSES